MNLSVRQKLLSNALLAIAPMLVIGVAGYIGTYRVDGAMGRIVDILKVREIRG